MSSSSKKRLNIIIDETDLPMIAAWLIYVEDRCPDYPTVWGEMLKSHKSAISLIITLKKLVNDNRFHWLRYYDNVSSWLDKCLQDPEC